MKINQQGQVFVLAVIILGLIMVNTIVIMAGSITYNQNARYSVNSSKALQLAEAGIDKAVTAINSNPNGYNGEPETTLGDGTYSVVITNKNNQTKAIESTGYIPNKSNPLVKRTIQIELSKGVGISFNYGVQVGDGGLEMANNATINGSIYSNGNIEMDNNARINGDAYVAGGTAPTSDQSNDCTGVNCADFIFGKTVNSNNQLDIAQSFKPSTTAVLNKVELKLKKVGSPPNITVRILGDNNGSPNKDNVLASGTLSSNLVTSEYSPVMITFTTTPTLNANTSYWIVLDTSSNSSNYWQWSNDTAQGYTFGTAKWSPNWQAANPVWNSITGDLGFATFMGGVITSIIGTSNSLITGDAHANTLQNLIIQKGAYYQSAQNITAATHYPNSPDPAPQAMPISEANITTWKNQATEAGIFNGDITTCQTTLAPGKYVGNINLPGNCITTVGTPIWVTGSLTMNGNVTIKLDPTYGSSSGVFMVDNFITMNNNGTVQGSGTNGSYLVLVSNFNSRDDPSQRIAIDIQNNGNSGIVYANLGKIRINNNNDMTEVTGWKLQLENNVIVNYEQGLAAAFFSSGPVGGFSAVKGTYQIK